MGDLFQPVEDALAQVFLPALLGVDADWVAEHRDLLALPVKCGGLGIPNPVDEGDRHHATSVGATAHLAAALAPEGPAFSLGEHVVVAREARSAARATRMGALEEKLAALTQGRPQVERRRIKRSRECGAWLTVVPLQWAGTGLEAEEFRDAIRLRYGLVPEGMVERWIFFCYLCAK